MPYLPLLAALAFVLSPLVVGGFGGFDPNAFPVPQDDPPVQPAGWAFAIWGVIYLWLVVHAAFGALRRRDASGWKATRLPLTLSLAVGAAWIPVANASPLAATVLILAMLVTALWAVLRAGETDPWLLAVPLGLYAGWLTAASAVSVALVAAGYGLLSERIAAILALALVIPVALAVLRQRPTLAYPAALVWALGAITLRGVDPVVSALACALALGLAAAAALRLRA